MLRLTKYIDQLILQIGQKSAWLNLILVGLICIDVLQRYLLNQTFNWVLELEWHIFGLIFLLGSAFTFQSDQHVRVDVFYHSFSTKTKAKVNIAGNILLLIPWCIVGISTCYKYASTSFYIRENSPNPGGLPAWYIIKYCMVLGFVLMLMQAVSSIYRQFNVIKQ